MRRSDSGSPSRVMAWPACRLTSAPVSLASSTTLSTRRRKSSGERGVRWLSLWMKCSAAEIIAFISSISASALSRSGGCRPSRRNDSRASGVRRSCAIAATMCVRSLIRRFRRACIALNESAARTISGGPVRCSAAASGLRPRRSAASAKRLIGADSARENHQASGTLASRPARNSSTTWVLNSPERRRRGDSTVRQRPSGCCRAAVKPSSNGTPGVSRSLSQAPCISSGPGPVPDSAPGWPSRGQLCGKGGRPCAPARSSATPSASTARSWVDHRCGGSMTGCGASRSLAWR